MRAIKLFAELTGAPLPEVFHTNEGHAGFLGLERISDLIGDGLTFAEALQVVRAGTVFTTHTPVPAGIDRFDARTRSSGTSPPSCCPASSPTDVLALGSRTRGRIPTTRFNMAVMGLRLGQRANGVSKLHGEVSRDMFGDLWPGFDADEVPITSVTNGVHAPTWTDPRLVGLAADEARHGRHHHVRLELAMPSPTAICGVMRNGMRAAARRRRPPPPGRGLARAAPRRAAAGVVSATCSTPTR